MRGILRNSLLFGMSPKPEMSESIQPFGTTVDQRLRSLMAHPLYGDPDDARLRDHVAAEFARAYPETDGGDATGRMIRTGPAIRPEEVRPFPPPAEEPGAPSLPGLPDAERAPSPDLAKPWLQPLPKDWQGESWARPWPAIAKPPRPGQSPEATVNLLAAAGAEAKPKGGVPPERVPGSRASGQAEDAAAPPLSNLEARQAARHGTSRTATLPEIVGRAIPTEAKIPAMAGAGKILGWEQAARALDHYRGASGKPLEMPPDWLRAQPEILEAEEVNRKNLRQDIINDSDLKSRIGVLKEGQSITNTVTQKNKKIKADGRGDLHYASGKSNLDTNTTLTFTRKGDEIAITGDQTHRWHDMYDWAKGSKFLGGTVTGDEMIALEERGKAKTFEMVGAWGGKVSGRILIGPDGKLSEPDFNWATKKEQEKGRR